MSLPGELRVPDELDAQCDGPACRGGFAGRLDIAALLEEQLILPEGVDCLDGDPAVLDQLFDLARAKSEPALGAHALRPVRDPFKDHLLAWLHAAEAFHPEAFALMQDLLLVADSALGLASLALNAVAVWCFWQHGCTGVAIAGAVLLLAHYPASAALLALQLKGHHRASAWLAVPLYDLAAMAALPPLQRRWRRWADRRRLFRRWPRLAEAELWLWQYRALRQVVMALLHALPIAVLMVVGLASVKHTAAVPLPGWKMGVAAAAAATAAAAAALWLGEAALNARWGGQMSLLSYLGLALRLRGSKKLPYEWQSQLAEQRLNIKPDAPDFVELSRLQRCQILRLALMRPHFTVSNAATHPRPPPRVQHHRKSSAAGSASGAAAAEAGAGGGRGGQELALTSEGCWRSPGAAAGCGHAVAGCGAAVLALRAAFAKVPGCGLMCAPGAKAARRGSGGSDSGSDSDGRRPQAPPSACLLLTTKGAVKAAVELMQGPLAAARYSLMAHARPAAGSSSGGAGACAGGGAAGGADAGAGGPSGEFGVNLVSFVDAAACKHCCKLLDMVVRQGLQSLMLCDSKLPLDFFGVLTGYLPSPKCVLRKLVLKDVMGSGISTLCMLCDALSHNSSVTSLDLSNNQLWGLRGAKELRAMLRRNGGLRTLLVPFCNIASPGAIEILKGAAENATLAVIDLSQNHVGDDTPDWADLYAAAAAAAAEKGAAAAAAGPGGAGGAAGPRNGVMREIDLSFNWVQESLAAWTASLLEMFPTLTRLLLNHNSDAAASRVVSRAATPRTMTPRTLTPRTLTPSNLRPASVTASAAAAGGGGAAALPSPAALQQAPSSSMLSPTVSERLAALPMAGGGGGGGGVGAGAMLALRQSNYSVASAADWQNQLHSQYGAAPPLPPWATGGGGGGGGGGGAGDAPSRSRGQHLITHLELYTLSRTAGAGGGGGAAGLTSFGAATALLRRSLARASGGAVGAAPQSGGGGGGGIGGGGGGLSGSLGRVAARMVSAWTTKRSGNCGAGGGDGPSGSGAAGGLGGGGTTSGALVSSNGGSGPLLSQSTAPMLGSTTGAAAAAAAAAAGRPANSLWVAVAAMERLDLRGLPFPAWWARSAAKPSSVVIDDSQVYDDGVGGGGGGGGGGALAAAPAPMAVMELPLGVVRMLESGLSQGMLVVDLTSPDLRCASRAVQLAAVYLALQHATHITISNAPRAAGPGAGPASLAAAQQQQLQSIMAAAALNPLAGGGAGANLALLRSSTSSFARANSGTAGFGGPWYGGAAGGRLHSETGQYTGGGGGGAVGLPQLSPRYGSVATSGTANTVAAAAAALGGGGGSSHLTASGSYRSGAGAVGPVGPLTAAALLPASLAAAPADGAAATAAWLGAGGAAGGASSRLSQTRRNAELASGGGVNVPSISSLHRFAMQRSGSSVSNSGGGWPPVPPVGLTAAGAGAGAASLAPPPPAVRHSMQPHGTVHAGAVQQQQQQPPHMFHSHYVVGPGAASGRFMPAGPAGLNPYHTPAPWYLGSGGGSGIYSGGAGSGVIPTFPIPGQSALMQSQPGSTYGGPSGSRVGGDVEKGPAVNDTAAAAAGAQAAADGADSHGGSGDVSLPGMAAAASSQSRGNAKADGAAAGATTASSTSACIHMQVPSAAAAAATAVAERRRQRQLRRGGGDLDISTAGLFVIGGSSRGADNSGSDGNGAGEDASMRGEGTGTDPGGDTCGDTGGDTGGEEADVAGLVQRARGSGRASSAGAFASAPAGSSCKQLRAGASGGLDSADEEEALLASISHVVVTGGTRGSGERGSGPGGGSSRPSGGSGGGRIAIAAGGPQISLAPGLAELPRFSDVGGVGGGSALTTIDAIFGTDTAVSGISPFMAKVGAGVSTSCNINLSVEHLACGGGGAGRDAEGEGDGDAALLTMPMLRMRPPSAAAAAPAHLRHERQPLASPLQSSVRALLETDDRDVYGDGDTGTDADGDGAAGAEEADGAAAVLPSTAKRMAMGSAPPLLARAAARAAAAAAAAAGAGGSDDLADLRRALAPRISDAVAGGGEPASGRASSALTAGAGGVASGPSQGPLGGPIGGGDGGRAVYGVSAAAMIGNTTSGTLGSSLLLESDMGLEMIEAGIAMLRAGSTDGMRRTAPRGPHGAAAAAVAGSNAARLRALSPGGPSTAGALDAASESLSCLTLDGSETMSGSAAVIAAAAAGAAAATPTQRQAASTRSRVGSPASPPPAGQGAAAIVTIDAARPAVLGAVGDLLTTGLIAAGSSGASTGAPAAARPGSAAAAGSLPFPGSNTGSSSNAPASAGAARESAGQRSSFSFAPFRRSSTDVQGMTAAQQQHVQALMVAAAAPLLVAAQALPSNGQADADADAAVVTAAAARGQGNADNSSSNSNSGGTFSPEANVVMYINAAGSLRASGGMVVPWVKGRRGSSDAGTGGAGSSPTALLPPPLPRSTSPAPIVSAPAGGCGAGSDASDSAAAGAGAVGGSPINAEVISGVLPMVVTPVLAPPTMKAGSISNGSAMAALASLVAAAATPSSLANSGSAAGASTAEAMAQLVAAAAAALDSIRWEDNRAAGGGSSTGGGGGAAAGGGVERRGSGWRGSGAAGGGGAEAAPMEDEYVESELDISFRAEAEAYAALRSLRNTSHTLASGGNGYGSGEGAGSSGGGAGVIAPRMLSDLLQAGQLQQLQALSRQHQAALVEALAARQGQGQQGPAPRQAQTGEQLAQPPQQQQQQLEGLQAPLAAAAACAERDSGDGAQTPNAASAAAKSHGLPAEPPAAAASAPAPSGTNGADDSLRPPPALAAAAVPETAALRPAGRGKPPAGDGPAAALGLAAMRFRSENGDVRVRSALPGGGGGGGGGGAGSRTDSAAVAAAGLPASLSSHRGSARLAPALLAMTSGMGVGVPVLARRPSGPPSAPSAMLLAAGGAHGGGGGGGPLAIALPPSLMRVTSSRRASFGLHTHFETPAADGGETSTANSSDIPVAGPPPPVSVPPPASGGAAGPALGRSFLRPSGASAGSYPQQPGANPISLPPHLQLAMASNGSTAGTAPASAAPHAAGQTGHMHHLSSQGWAPAYGGAFGGARRAFTGPGGGPSSDGNDTDAFDQPAATGEVNNDPGVMYDGAAGGGAAAAALPQPSMVRAAAAAAAALGLVGSGGGGGGGVGVEASNAVAVVLVVGGEGMLRMPLRALELPLRAALARRPGTTVSFRVSGLSHDGMRQLRALMGIAKVPMPERTYAWLLPSQSMQHLSITGVAPPPGAGAAAAGYSGYNALGFSGYAGGGGVSGGQSGLRMALQSLVAMGSNVSRAVSRMDSGNGFAGGGGAAASGTGTAMYSHMPSYYDNLGAPLDLGYILPPMDSAEPSGYLSGYMMGTYAPQQAAAAAAAYQPQGTEAAAGTLDSPPEGAQPAPTAAQLVLQSQPSQQPLPSQRLLQAPPGVVNREELLALQLQFSRGLCSGPNSMDRSGVAGGSAGGAGGGGSSRKPRSAERRAGGANPGQAVPAGSNPVAAAAAAAAAFGQAYADGRSGADGAGGGVHVSAPLARMPPSTAAFQPGLPPPPPSNPASRRSSAVSPPGSATSHHASHAAHAHRASLGSFSSRPGSAAAPAPVPAPAGLAAPPPPEPDHLQSPFGATGPAGTPFQGHTPRGSPRGTATGEDPAAAAAYLQQQQQHGMYMPHLVRIHTGHALPLSAGRRPSSAAPVATAAGAGTRPLSGAMSLAAAAPPPPQGMVLVQLRTSSRPASGRNVLPAGQAGAAASSSQPSNVQLLLGRGAHHGPSPHAAAETQAAVAAAMAALAERANAAGGRLRPLPPPTVLQASGLLHGAAGGGSSLYGSYGGGAAGAAAGSHMSGAYVVSGTVLSSGMILASGGDAGGGGGGAGGGGGGGGGSRSHYYSGGSVAPVGMMDSLPDEDPAVMDDDEDSKFTGTLENVRPSAGRMRPGTATSTGRGAGAGVGDLRSGNGGHGATSHVCVGAFGSTAEYHHTGSVGQQQYPSAAAAVAAASASATPAAALAAALDAGGGMSPGLLPLPSGSGWPRVALPRPSGAGAGDDSGCTAGSTGGVQQWAPLPSLGRVNAAAVDSAGGLLSGASPFTSPSAASGNLLPPPMASLLVSGGSLQRGGLHRMTTGGSSGRVALGGLGFGSTIDMSAGNAPNSFAAAAAAAFVQQQQQHQHQQYQQQQQYLQQYTQQQPQQQYTQHAQQQQQQQQQYASFGAAADALLPILPVPIPMPAGPLMLGPASDAASQATSRTASPMPAAGTPAGGRSGATSASAPRSGANAQPSKSPSPTALSSLGMLPPPDPLLFTQEGVLLPRRTSSATDASGPTAAGGGNGATSRHVLEHPASRSSPVRPGSAGADGGGGAASHRHGQGLRGQGPYGGGSAASSPPTLHLSGGQAEGSGTSADIGGPSAVAAVATAALEAREGAGGGGGLLRIGSSGRRPAAEGASSIGSGGGGFPAALQQRVMSHGAPSHPGSAHGQHSALMELQQQGGVPGSQGQPQQQMQAQQVPQQMQMQRMAAIPESRPFPRQHHNGGGGGGDIGLSEGESGSGGDGSHDYGGDGQPNVLYSGCSSGEGGSSKLLLRRGGTGNSGGEGGDTGAGAVGVLSSGSHAVGSGAAGGAAAAAGGAGVGGSGGWPVQTLV